MAFQPAASGSPTAWSATGLPEGVTIDESTGLISGEPVLTGSFVTTISATNVDGTGTLEFFIGVLAPTGSTLAAADLSPLLQFDVESMSVKNGSATIVAAETAAAAAAAAAAGQQAPAAEKPKEPLFAKRGDAGWVRVIFTRGATQIDPVPDTLKIRIKSSDEEVPVVVSTTMERDGSGSSAVFRLWCDWGAPAVFEALDNVRVASGTEMTMLGDIEITRDVAVGASTETSIRTSRTFPVLVQMDLD